MNRCLAYTCALAMTLMACAARAEANPDDAAASLRAALSQCALTRLSHPGPGAFSVEVAIGMGNKPKVRESIIAITSSDDDARMVVLADDGRPYAIIQDGLTISLFDAGNSLRVFRGGGFLFAVGEEILGEGNLTFGVRASLLRASRIDIRLNRLITASIDRATSVTYDAAELEGHIRLQDRDIKVKFEKRGDDALGISDIQAIMDGSTVVRISNIRDNGNADLIRADMFISLWQASGGQVTEIALADLQTNDLLPSSGWQATANAARRIDQVVALAKNWPKSSTLLDVVQPQDEGVPAGVLAQRQSAREIFYDSIRNPYSRLAELAALLDSKDPVTRRGAMLCLRFPLPRGFKESKTVENLILRGIRDDAQDVRELALSALATHASSGTVAGDKFFSEITKVLENSPSAHEIRMAAFCVALFSKGDFSAGNYPQDAKGWPKYDQDATAWWLVHGDHIRTNALAWLSERELKHRP